MESTSVPQPLSWFEGMLLTPQHMQQNDIYWARSLHHQMAQLQPFYHGVISMRLNGAALQSGYVQVDALRCVMPDGLVVEVPRDTGFQVLRYPAEGNLELASGERRKIVLVVPKRTDGAASPDSPICRFDTVPGELVKDENTGQDSEPIARLRPRVSLLAAGEHNATHVVLPLFEVEGSTTGKLVPTDYHPPMLRLSASDFLDEVILDEHEQEATAREGGQAAGHSEVPPGLHRQLRRLIARVRARANEYAGKTDDASSAVSVSTTAQRHTAMRHLVSPLLALEVMVETGVSHPFEVYQALARMLGEVAPIDTLHPVPPKLPRYDHENCMHGVREVLGEIRSRLGALPELYHIDRFDYDETLDRFRYPLAPPEREGMQVERIVVELKPRRGVYRETVERWITNARVASEEHLDELVTARLPGGAVRAIRPEELKTMDLEAGALVYEIRNQLFPSLDGDKRAIEPGRSFVIENQEFTVDGRSHESPVAEIFYLQRVAEAGPGAGQEG